MIRCLTFQLEHTELGCRLKPFLFLCTPLQKECYLFRPLCLANTPIDTLPSDMSEKCFFMEDWIGKQITFPSTTEPSEWRLERKLGEKDDQPTAYAYNVDSILKGRAGGAYAPFACRNTKTNELAVIKILMQVPWEGSEYVSASERAKQATTTLPDNAELDVNPLLILTENKCTAAPLVRAYRKTVQDLEDGLVPGGFLHFVLMDHAPGQQLSHEMFWGFERRVRDEIRGAFRAAWEYV